MTTEVLSFVKLGIKRLMFCLAASSETEKAFFVSDETIRRNIRRIPILFHDSLSVHLFFFLHSVNPVACVNGKIDRIQSMGFEAP